MPASGITLSNAASDAASVTRPAPDTPAARTAPPAQDPLRVDPSLREVGPKVVSMQELPDDIRRELPQLVAPFTTALPTGDTGRPALKLIGRREVRSNNSWMHNSERLVTGKPRCTLWMHPQDAAQRGLHDGQRVAVSSRVGQTTLRSSNMDSEKKSLVWRPLAPCRIHSSSSLIAFWRPASASASSSPAAALVRRPRWR